MEKKKKTIPPKERTEWRKILNGEIQHQFSNYVLQLQFHQAQKDIKRKKIDIEQAISNIYELCSKYTLAVQIDLRQIFKSW